MAIEYPNLIKNAQFIYCSELDDPECKLAGRTPLFRPLHISSLTGPYLDEVLASEHYNGYNKPYSIFNLKSMRQINSPNYMKYVNNPPFEFWKERFDHDHRNIGEYFDWVHEFPNDPEHRSINTDRPSYSKPEPHTIFKEPDKRRIMLAVLAYGVSAECFLLAIYIPHFIITGQSLI